MQLNITGRHMALTTALRSYVQQKIMRLERHFDHVTHSHVILKLDRKDQVAEATVNIAGSSLFAQSRQSDMYNAIDRLVEKLDAQIIKHKAKLIDKR